MYKNENLSYKVCKATVLIVKYEMLNFWAFDPLGLRSVWACEGCVNDLLEV